MKGDVDGMATFRDGGLGSMGRKLRRLLRAPPPGAGPYALTGSLGTDMEDDAATARSMLLCEAPRGRVGIMLVDQWFALRGGRLGGPPMRVGAEMTGPEGIDEMLAAADALSCAERSFSVRKRERDTLRRKPHLLFFSFPSASDSSV
jgi:hypothetical protein